MKTIDHVFKMGDEEFRGHGRSRAVNMVSELVQRRYTFWSLSTSMELGLSARYSAISHVYMASPRLHGKRSLYIICITRTP